MMTIDKAMSLEKKGVGV